MIPWSLAANPRLDRWVRFEADGKIGIAFGKMEYGQGIFTSLAQMAADELDVAFERLDVTPSATDEIPDEGLTVGSMTTETSGASLRQACAEVRALFVAAAAAKLGCDPSALDVRDGAVLRDGAPSGETYWTLADAVDLTRPPTGEAAWKSPDRLTQVGQSQPRLDLPPKVFGAAFLHDLLLPGMRHARILRQPNPGARFVGLDETAVRRAAGEEVDILVEGSFVALICATEPAAGRALAAAEASARWDGVRDVTPAFGEAVALKDMPQTIDRKSVV